MFHFSLLPLDEFQETPLKFLSWESLPAKSDFSFRQSHHLNRNLPSGARVRWGSYFFHVDQYDKEGFRKSAPMMQDADAIMNDYGTLFEGLGRARAFHK
ncbi:hypothetical protein AVEN_129434-1 [Araneus ventricosus]|uniref:Uncharacterized protein n=1 Tax=Araneus ventricosus TaxID=182803 RepID=A0A4Y2R6I3_ARAVE|nr:hypothetical protein AVEN_129434-1 [Araneus ventricosus]